MFFLLESRKEITKAQRKLKNTIRRQLRKKYVRNIGYPGGRIFDTTVFTDGDYWFWSNDNEVADEPNPRRANWFGLFREGHSDLLISVEINTPLEGRNDRVAGFFAKDTESGIIYLMHSGRVAGGTKGVGKSAFLVWSNLKPIEVYDSSGESRDGVPVMPIEGEDAVHSAIKYVDTIAGFKLAVREGKTATQVFKQKMKEFEEYYSESRGRRKGKRSSNIDYISRHGEIVDALQIWVSSQSLPRGTRLVKNVLIDLGVAVRNHLVEVYEVKTSASRSDIYSAIGQLLVHGTNSDCQRILVLPQDEFIADDLVNAMMRLSIKLVRFEFSEVETRIIS